MESNYRDIVQGWLSLQTSMVAGVTRAVVFPGEPEIDPVHPVATWPEQATVPQSCNPRCHSGVNLIRYTTLASSKGRKRKKQVNKESGNTNDTEPEGIFTPSAHNTGLSSGKEAS